MDLAHEGLYTLGSTAPACRGRGAQAAEQARRTLAVLNQHPDLDSLVLDAPHFPPTYDLFRVEWERAAWSHAGEPGGELQAKRELMRWRLHALLAGLTDNLTHSYEAVLARPDMPVTRAVLGCALARRGEFAEAISHLRRTLADNPFNLATARSLFYAQSQADDEPGQSQLAHQRRLLARAAPQAVPPEPWFDVECAARTGPTTETQISSQPALGIIWEGAQLALHSLALVNREICLRLIQHGHELALLPTGHEETAADAVAAPALLKERLHRHLTQPADVHIRHHWPPNFTPPSEGHWVLMQSWEFGR